MPMDEPPETDPLVYLIPHATCKASLPLPVIGRSIAVDSPKSFSRREKVAESRMRG